MDQISYFIKYTVLGITAAILYALDLSLLLTSISGFVFLSCITVIVLMSGYNLAFNRYSSTNRIFIPPNSKIPANVQEKHEKTTPRAYPDQIAYPGIGPVGQSLLSEKHVCIIGLSGVGTACAELLARAGIGKISLFDGSKVDLHDLQDHAIFGEGDIGNTKCVAAEHILYCINPEVKVLGHKVEINNENKSLIDADIVIDCTNELNIKNVTARYCRMQKIPYVFCFTSMKRGYIKLMIDESFSSLMQVLQVQPQRSSYNPNIHMGAGIATNVMIQHLLKKPIPDVTIKYNVWSPEIKLIQHKK